MDALQHARVEGPALHELQSIVDDVKNAGGVWVDEACVVDGPIITARTPDDLPAFMTAILSLLETGKAQGTIGMPVAPAWVK